jgi:hypothetical protein
MLKIVYPNLSTFPNEFYDLIVSGIDKSTSSFSSITPARVGELKASSNCYQVKHNWLLSERNKEN